MSKIGLILLLAIPGFAAVTGTVINQTTGKPQAGATVGLNKLGQGGIELINQAKSDAQGNFTIDQELEKGMPHLIRTAFDGVTYNHMLPPGTPTTGITIDVYNASRQPGGAKVSKHLILFEPAGGQMMVREFYLFTNDGKTAWSDPDNGTLHFFLPASAGGKATLQGSAPGGLPIPIAYSKAGNADTYKVDFAIKPGSSRIDLAYQVPYTEGAPYEGKIISGDENSYLSVPPGVTLTAEGITDLGQDPNSQDRVYGLAGRTYKVQLTGWAAAEAPPAAAADGADGSADQDGAPRIEQVMPRVNSQTTVILALVLGILAIGFVLLYRARMPEEANGRDRG